MCNKIDLTRALPVEQIQEHLKPCLGEHAEDEEDDEGRPLKVVMCSAVKRIGLGDGMKWLLEHACK